MTSLKNRDTYHRRKQNIPSWVRQTIDGKEIIHGARSLNAQFQSQHLRQPTRDFDVFSEHPKKSARDTEQFLDKRMNFNAFETRKSKIHPSTFKVRSRVTGNTVADFTKPKKKVDFKIINGKRYSTLNYMEQHTKKTLREGTATHRLHKDKDALARIKLQRRQNLQWK